MRRTVMNMDDKDIEKDLNDNQSVDASDVTEGGLNKNNDAEQQIYDLNNKLLRLQADFDNYRKRTAREKTEIYKCANQDLVCAMLPVIDNFQRAITANENKEDSFSIGIAMIYKQIEDLLQREGLVPIESLGKDFDPNLHEAVMNVESNEHRDNEIVEELQKGYIFKDKVVKPSMVKVANTK